jgi:dipeptidyl aminopeptidase/acylaminoacyl peptidase
MPLGEGKPTKSLALGSGIRSALLSPDGTRFAILADPRKKDELAEFRTVVENGQTSLYVLSTGDFSGSWWCPDFKDIRSIAWSPDGSEVAIASDKPKIGHHEVESSIDVCSASGSRRVYTVKNSISGIAWANGGKELVFAGTTTPVLTPDHLWTVPASGGNATDRTPKLDGSITDVANDPHGTVWVQMHKGVVIEVASYRDGKLETGYRWPEGTMESFPAFSQLASSPEVLAFTVGDPTHEANVAVVQDGSLRKITNEGDDTLANVDLGDERTVRWTAQDGTKLEGIATFPAGYAAGKRYPFLVLPHGGPEGNDVLDFDFFPRLIAGMGYVVLQPEYRGSTGYGSDFLASIYQHFGDRAYSDVDSATDFAIEQGWADPNRLAIFGWSAGGFMTSWTVTQTHRYRAAIEGAGITDWLSFIPTSDISQVDYDARWPESNAEPFLKFSAVNFADRVTTPLLILHGEADVRVPAFQGREYFILLAERGKTVRMVTYPGSPHFPKLAEQRRNIFEEVSSWLTKYNP